MGSLFFHWGPDHWTSLVLVMSMLHSASGYMYTCSLKTTKAVEGCAHLSPIRDPGIKGLDCPSPGRALRSRQEAKPAQDLPIQTLLPTPCLPQALPRPRGIRAHLESSGISHERLTRYRRGGAAGGLSLEPGHPPDLTWFLLIAFVTAPPAGEIRLWVEMGLLNSVLYPSSTLPEETKLLIIFLGACQKAIPSTQ